NHPADSYLRFQNIDCRNWINLEDGEQGYYIFANHVEVVGGKVHDGPQETASHSSPCCHGFYVSGAYNVIDGVEIYNNSGIGLQFYNGYHIEELHDNIIRNCRVYNNGQRGSNSTSTGGIVSFGNNGLIYNNVVYNHARSFGIGTARANNTGIY